SAYLFERSSFRHRQVGVRHFESNTLWWASFASRGRYNGRHFSVDGTRDRLPVRLFGRLGGPIADAVSRCASGLSRHFTRHRLYRRAGARAGSCDSFCVICSHFLLNLLLFLFIQATFILVVVIISEGSLSFLGFGV